MSALSATAAGRPRHAIKVGRVRGEHYARLSIPGYLSRHIAPSLFRPFYRDSIVVLVIIDEPASSDIRVCGRAKLCPACRGDHACYVAGLRAQQAGTATAAE